jgi:hypothetical protein
MPEGFKGVRGASADIEARRSGSGSRWFKLQDGETARVRFLEQEDEVKWCWQHELPFSTSGKNWGDKLVCRDQKNEGEPCPGCAQGMKRGFRGYINLIQRNAPKFDTNSEGRTDWSKKVGEEDAVLTWEGGITLFEELDLKDSKWHGLRSRDFEVTRKGTGLATRYIIEPVDEHTSAPVAMSEADVKLAQSKQDLNEKVIPPSLEEWNSKLAGGGTSPEAQDESSSNGESVNPFMQS